MIRHVMESMGGIELYGLVSLTLFFVFFTGMLVWVLFLKKSYLNEMREIPLNDGVPALNPGEQS